MNKERPEVLQKIEEFEEQLRQLGITPDKVGEVTALIGQLGELQGDLEVYRRQQFFDDANDLVYQISGRGGDKMMKVSMFLREFAEHIAGHVLGGDQWVPQDGDGRTAADLIDHVPTMHVDEQ